jgi:hypothetical protein
MMALAMLLFLGGASSANDNASHFKMADGKITVAQNSCGICAEQNTSCRLGCNGSGACIQACGDHYKDCLRQSFCRR